MTMYVYGTRGEPRGYLFETTIFSLSGAPLGRVLGSRVHRFDGTYVGEWFHQMVVERPTGRARTIPPVPAPAARTAVAACFPRREVAEYGNFADAFDLLAEAEPDAVVPEAAE